MTQISALTDISADIGGASSNSLHATLSWCQNIRIFEDPRTIWAAARLLFSEDMADWPRELPGDGDYSIPLARLGLTLKVFSKEERAGPIDQALRGTDIISDIHASPLVAALEEKAKTSPLLLGIASVSEYRCLEGVSRPLVPVDAFRQLSVFFGGQEGYLLFEDRSLVPKTGHDRIDLERRLAKLRATEDLTVLADASGISGAIFLPGGWDMLAGLIHLKTHHALAE